MPANPRRWRTVSCNDSGNMGTMPFCTVVAEISRLFASYSVLSSLNLQSWVIQSHTGANDADGYALSECQVVTAVEETDATNKCEVDDLKRTLVPALSVIFSTSTGQELDFGIDIKALDFLAAAAQRESHPYLVHL
jgi:hypothetical protein